MFTDEQAAAIFTDDKNLVVVAGAGSGKTHVLVERYITLLADNPTWPLNALVAITFTREAALEMRNRVRRKLEDRVRAADNVITQRRWSELLAQMDSARIDTIHGLCATILRANAAEAQVDPAFDVLDEVDSDILLSDIITTQLQAIVDDADEDTAALFTEYEMRRVREVLANPALLRAAMGEATEDAAALLANWQAEWLVDYNEHWQRLVNNSAFIQAGEWQPSVPWPEDDKLFTSWRLVHMCWPDLLNGEPETTLQAAATLLDGINLVGGSQKRWGGKEAKETAKEALRTIRTELAHFADMVGTPPGEQDIYAAAMTVRWHRLLARVQAAYQTEKQRLGVLDFDDLEARTAQLLQDHPSVRERYRGVAFKRLLVDEFQDTNAAQWAIVRLLADVEGDTALFVVGDMKQSIYGFRGADVRVFGSVREQIAQFDTIAGTELTLSRSFRSHPGLIEIFNKLFARTLVRDDESTVSKYAIGFDPGVDEMDAHRPPLTAEARAAYHPIELILLRSKQAHLKERISAQERRQWEAELLAQRLHQLKREAAPIYDKSTETYRPFNYSDTAILFQSTGHITVYEAVFKALQLPFVTVGGRGYYNRQEVWDVLNLLRALHNPADDLSLAAALRSPMFGFSDDMLFALRLLRDEGGDQVALWDALAVSAVPHLSAAETARVTRAHQTLTQLQRLAGRVTISELLRQALGATGYLALLTGLPDGARLRRNVEKLIDIAERSGKITLGAFAYYLADLSAREVREGEAALDASGAVRLMTVHASKGLEFPIVVLADAGWVRSGGGGQLVTYDDDKQRIACMIFDPNEHKYVPTYPYHQAQQQQRLREAAERKRLLYVAATRARDCLMIAGEVGQNSAGWTSRGWLGELIVGFDVEGAQDGATVQYTPDGTLSVSLPDFDPGLPKRLQQDVEDVKWPTVDRTVVVEQPQQLRPLHIAEEEMLGHIAATQLAGLGGLRYANDGDTRQYFAQQVRRQILDDAEVQIRDAVRTRPPRVRARRVGDVVHEALRFWRFPDTNDNIDAILRSYAWQQSVTDDGDVQEVVQRAHILLELFQRSELYREISRVRARGLPYYAEMPFIYRTDKRILHGMIDALYQREDGTWALVDYKTSYVDLQQMTTAQHARRYHLQVGAYASAIQQELGELPTAYIHYIQYNDTVEIPAVVWQAEIAQLEEYIGDLLGDNDA